MKKRIYKKRVKRVMDWFTKAKVPNAFSSEVDRKRWVSAFARRAVGQRYTFPEDLT